MNMYQDVNGQQYLHLDALLTDLELHKQKMSELKVGDLICISALSGWALKLYEVIELYDGSFKVEQRGHTLLKSKVPSYSIVS